jgi:hypothetical protein
MGRNSMKRKSFCIDETIRDLRRSLDNRAIDLEAAVHFILVQTGNASPMINKSRAYKKYGRSNVDNWVKWGLLDEVKDGDGNHEIRFEVARLMQLARTSNRCEFYEHKI